MMLNICGRFDLISPPIECTHMISIGDPDVDLETNRLPHIKSKSHLCMNFRDRKSINRKDAPTETDILPLFHWLDSVGKINHLLVHCGAGMSRSPAIALLTICYLEPEADPFSQMIRVASCTKHPHPWPNPLVVEIGDRILE